MSILPNFSTVALTSLSMEATSPASALMAMAWEAPIFSTRASAEEALDE